MRKRVDKKNDDSTEINFSFGERYFLRRLAIARHQKYSHHSVPYWTALMEVSLICIVFPVLGVYSFVAIVADAYVDIAKTMYFGLSFRYLGVVLGGMSLTAGCLYFNRRFFRHREDESQSLNFDTEKDHRVVFWQQICIFVCFGVVMPWSAFLITQFSFR